jgi:hypothetical protein
MHVLNDHFHINKIFIPIEWRQIQTIKKKIQNKTFTKIVPGRSNLI